VVSWCRPGRPGFALFRKVHYSVPSTYECSTHACIHWVASTADSPPPEDADSDGVPDWIRTNLDVVEEVWTAEVTSYGFRAPKSDLISVDHGPDGWFDVYLADIGPQLYGYCVSDDSNVDGSLYAYYDVSAYCVFDNNFVAEEFGMIFGLEALPDTAAHEVLHAVQAAYDWWEDLWLLEGSPAWIEDEVYDEIDRYNFFYGNRNPLGHPEIPVDHGGAWFRYGEWFFWRFLSEYFGSPSQSDRSVMLDVLGVGRWKPSGS